MEESDGGMMMMMVVVVVVGVWLRMIHIVVHVHEDVADAAAAAVDAADYQWKKKYGIEVCWR